MPAGCGNFQSALGRLLPANIFKGERVSMLLAKKTPRIDTKWLRIEAAGVQKLPDLNQGADGKYVHPLNDRSLCRITLGNDKIGDTTRTSSDRNGQHTRNRAQRAIEPELADQQVLCQVLRLQRTVSAENADGDGQVETRSFFLEIGRSQIDGDLRGWNVEAGVLDGRT